MDRTEYHANRKILDEVFETDLILTVPQLRKLIENYNRRKGKKSIFSFFF